MREIRKCHCGESFIAYFPEDVECRVCEPKIRKPRKGKVNCLKCGREFISPDVTKIRKCRNCKVNEDLFGSGGLDETRVRVPGFQLDPHFSEL